MNSAAVKKLVDFSAEVARECLALPPDNPEAVPDMPVDRLVGKLLFQAWCDAIRAEWYAWARSTTPGARKLVNAQTRMKADGYEDDPIVGLPGEKPMVASVGMKQCVSYEHSLRTATPLSAVYFAVLTDAMAAAAVEAAAGESVNEADANEARAKAAYEKMADNDPVVPSNRFTPWEELSPMTKAHWRDKHGHREPAHHDGQVPNDAPGTGPQEA